MDGRGASMDGAYLRPRSADRTRNNKCRIKTTRNGDECQYDFNGSNEILGVNKYSLIYASITLLLLG